MSTDPGCLPRDSVKFCLCSNTVKSLRGLSKVKGKSIPGVNKDLSILEDPKPGDSQGVETRDPGRKDGVSCVGP